MEQWWEDGYPEGHYCNIEQYRMLQRCSEKNDMSEWNQWRINNPKEEICLQGANFKGVRFKRANCARAKFSWAYCVNASFYESDCEGADFSNSDCRLATFHSSRCCEANFSFAKFWQADFRNSDCENTFFVGAQCENVDFTNANCMGSNFSFAQCTESRFHRTHLEGADFNQAFCEAASFIQAHCSQADFTQAKCNRTEFRSTRCNGAIFISAHCEGANFLEAHCEVAIFNFADCRDASFVYAHCEGASFIEANCQGANFSNTKLSSSTTIIGCCIDSKTIFSNSSLASVIIEPGKRAALERNVRESEWKRWYEESITPKPSEATTDQGKPSSKIKQTLKNWWGRYSHYKNYPAVILTRLFWHISDYGYSTQRILLYFLGFVITFALLYGILPEDTLSTKLDWIQLLLFAGATMVTFGFGDINAANTLGMAVVCANLMVGYFMLAVLVTRMAVLFQTMGPGSVLPKNTTK